MLERKRREKEKEKEKVDGEREQLRSPPRFSRQRVLKKSSFFSPSPLHSCKKKREGERRNVFLSLSKPPHLYAFFPLHFNDYGAVCCCLRLLEYVHTAMGVVNGRERKRKKVHRESVLPLSVSLKGMPPRFRRIFLSPSPESSSPSPAFPRSLSHASTVPRARLHLFTSCRITC